MKKKIAVLMGGRSSEHEVSLMSGREVMKNLDKGKYEVTEIIVGKACDDTQFVQELLKIKPDVVFIAMHGVFGEDGRIQGLLDCLNIKYVGSGVLASALGMDKVLFKKFMDGLNILTAKWEVVSKNKAISRLQVPIVIKPANGGSSVGVSIVRNEEELIGGFNEAFKWDNEVLVEEFIEGTEVTCGVIGNQNPVVLPLVEIVPKKEFFDYEAKYQSGMTDEIVPARISQSLTREIQEISLRIFKELKCRGVGRVDFIIKDNRPYVLEINTIPGMTPNSLLPKEAKAIGMDYTGLLDKLIELALE